MRASALALSVVVGAFSIVAVALPACSSKAGSGEPSCSAAPIDKLKELIVVDEPLLRDPRSLNTLAGPWSFRYVIENVSPEGGDAGAFVRAWLEEWATVREINGSPLDRTGETRDAEHFGDFW